MEKYIFLTTMRNGFSPLVLSQISHTHDTTQHPASYPDSRMYPNLFPPSPFGIRWPLSLATPAAATGVGAFHIEVRRAQRSDDRARGLPSGLALPLFRSMHPSELDDFLARAQAALFYFILFSICTDFLAFILFELELCVIVLLSMINDIFFINF